MRQCRRSTRQSTIHYSFCPLFLLLFFGIAVASIIGIITALVGWYEPRTLWLLIGGLFYLLGSFLATIRFNVPLNKALARPLGDPAGTSDLWARYLSRWTAWNHVRTILSLAATAAFILAAP